MSRQSSMLNVIVASLAVAAALSPMSGSASSESLDGNTLRRLITGKWIYLSTPLGGEIPLYYRADGRVEGSGESVGLGRWFKPTDTGRWWIAGDRLCQQWQTWYDGERMCFTVSSLGGRKIRWNRDNGETGLARLSD